MPRTPRGTSQRAESSPLFSMSVETDEFLIRGVTVDGRRFRPSDWAERLCGVMSQFGADGRVAYSPYVYLVNLDGVKCVAVDGRLREAEPMAYHFLVGFARDNELEVRRGPLSRAADAGVGPEKT